MSKSNKGGRTHVYTDGSAPGNGQAGAKGGVGAYFGPNDNRNVSAPLKLHNSYDRPSNQKAEIQAASEALKRVSPHENVVIHSDSQYVCKGMNNSIGQWRESGYKNVANEHYFRELDHQVSSRSGSTEFRHVPGHAGHYGNEQAHHLAQDGARRY